MEPWSGVDFGDDGLNTSLHDTLTYSPDCTAAPPVRLADLECWYFLCSVEVIYCLELYLSVINPFAP